MTNTYLPHVGGVASSVDRFTQAFRARGHRVMVIAPSYENQPSAETDVLRVPALQHFSTADFSVALSIPAELNDRLDRFAPEIVHSHHPFLLGDTALRIAAARNIPVLFTHHTLYEHYTHYVSADSEALKRFAMALATGYANLCDQVIAPSASIRDLLRGRGVRKPVTVIPSGVEVEQFRLGDGAEFRRQRGIAPEAFVIGYSGRLAPEKNLEALADGALKVLQDRRDAHLLMVGSGPCGEHMQQMFRRAGLNARLHLPGVLRGRELVNAYHAMDVFTFASRTETQGLVLAEAMAAGLPVVALDASGTRDILIDGSNGRLLPDTPDAGFAAALLWLMDLPASERERLRLNARQTAQGFAVAACGDRALALYETAIRVHRSHDEGNEDHEPSILRSLQEGWKVWGNRLSAVADAAHYGSYGAEDAP